MESVSLKEDKYLRSIYDLFHKNPEASSLAGRLFQKIVHRLLSEGSQSDKPTTMILLPFPQIPLPRPPLPLTASCHLSCAPAQGLSYESTSPMSSVMSPLIMTKTTSQPRPITPLFDSFTINFVISVFQITVSSTHGGLAVSYRHIHKIMARVRKNYILSAQLIPQCLWFNSSKSSFPDCEMYRSYIFLSLTRLSSGEPWLLLIYILDVEVKPGVEAILIVNHSVCTSSIKIK